MQCPGPAVTDLKQPVDCGLAFVTQMKRPAPDVPVLILTSYASVATAVDAFKRGAADCLIKPSTTDPIIHPIAPQGATTDADPLPTNALFIDRLEWEHINRGLLENDGNRPAAARALSMHRRASARAGQTTSRSLNYPHAVYSVPLAAIPAEG